MAVIKSQYPNTWTVAVCVYRHISRKLKGRKNSGREAKTKPVSLWSKCCKLQVFTSNVPTWLAQILFGYEESNYKWDYSLIFLQAGLAAGISGAQGSSLTLDQVVVNSHWAELTLAMCCTHPRRKCAFTHSSCAATLPLKGSFLEHSGEIWGCTVTPVGLCCKNSTSCWHSLSVPAGEGAVEMVRSCTGAAPGTAPKLRMLPSEPALPSAVPQQLSGSREGLPAVCDTKLSAQALPEAALRLPCGSSALVTLCLVGVSIRNTISQSNWVMCNSKTQHTALPWCSCGLPYKGVTQPKDQINKAQLTEKF